MKFTPELKYLLIALGNLQTISHALVRNSSNCVFPEHIVGILSIKYHIKYQVNNITDAELAITYEKLKKNYLVSDLPHRAIHSQTKYLNLANKMLLVRSKLRRVMVISYKVPKLIQ